MEHTPEQKKRYAERKKRKYHEDIEAARAKAKEWRDDNPDTVRAAAKRYYEKNREKLIANQLTRQKIKYADNPDYFKKANARRSPEQRSKWQKNSWCRTRFGIEATEYDSRMALQGNKCAICEAPFNGRNYALDHDHNTGKLREFLCKRCNAAMGWFADDAALLQKTVDYLKKHNTPP